MPAPASHKLADHLMVSPLPLRRTDGRLRLEAQACNGLDRWADNFQSLLVACPLMPEDVAERSKSISWRDVSTIPSIRRIEFVTLPWAPSAAEHVRELPGVRATLRELISRSRYLRFGIGGLWGDWAGVACEEAFKLNRPYATHLDRVEHELVIRTARSKSLPRRVKAWMTARLMRRWHRRLIERSALVMCHGNDCFEAYRRFNPNAHLIHNIHLSVSDQATPMQVEHKVRTARNAKRLRLCYAGRMDAEKAPLDWVRAIAHAVKQGADVEATWLGDGALRPQVEREIAKLNLSDRVELPGFIADRKTLLDAVRSADLFVFTHITPESPRCLIESLIVSTPIVGYESHYASDLIGQHLGGLLTPLGKPEALGDAIVALSRDRARLAELVQRAGRDGKRFTSESVFRERSELMKRSLPADVPEAPSASPAAAVTSA